MKTIKLNFSLEKEKFLAVADYFAEKEGTSLLYSGGDQDSSLTSFLSFFPKKAFSINSNKRSDEKLFPFERVINIEESDPWNILKGEVGELTSEKDDFPLWTGYLSYEFGQKKRTEATSSNKKYPSAYFLSHTVVIKYNHKTKETTIYILDDDIDHLSSYQKSWIERLSNINFWRGFIKDLSLKKVALKKIDENSNKEEVIEIPITPFCLKETYIEKIKGIQSHIRDGDVYEVNLSHEMVISNKNKKRPFSVFLDVNRINPAPFSAFLNLKIFSIVSSSPERFLSKIEDRLETRPIKGTINRGKTEKEDYINMIYLKSSEKEKAELRMITDLHRNDFYHVCEEDSIEVQELFKIEKYSNVFHMLSIITGKCKKDLHPADIINPCFPGGSITGCPKLASQNIISDFEKRERGVYTGSIGYFSSCGNFDFNVAIRTLVFLGDLVYLPVGGAILVDSEPEKEYLETYYKAKSMLKALGVEVKI